MPSTKKRSRRRDAGRPRGAPIAKSVLDAALADLADHGFEGLSIDRVARRAQVNKTSVYRRWPTREALVVAALELVLDRLSMQLETTGSLQGDLVALVIRVAHEVDTQAGRALFRAALSEPVRQLIVELAQRKAAEQVAGPAFELFARAVSRGEWNTHFAPQDVYSAIIGAVLHRIMLERAPVSESWAKGLIALVIEGLRPRI